MNRSKLAGPSHDEKSLHSESGRPRVFLSYMRQNRGRVDQLERELQAHGIEVWKDRTQLKAGQEWRDALRTAIYRSTFFIGCFSKEFNERPRSFMRQEVKWALAELISNRREKHWFVPLLLSGDELPSYGWQNGKLKDFHWIDFRKPLKNAFSELLSVIAPELHNVADLNKERRRARCFDLALQAQSAIIFKEDRSGSLPLLLAHHAVSATWDVDGITVPGSESVLRQAIQHAPPFRVALPTARHTERISALCFSSDGRFLVSAGWDGLVWLWDFAKGQAIRRLGQHTDPVLSAAISSDGHLIATGGLDCRVQVWDTEKGSYQASLKHDDWVTSLRFGKNQAQLLAGSRNGLVRTFDVRTFREIHHLSTGIEGLLSVSEDPSGQRLLCAGSDGQMGIWDAASGERLLSFSAGHGTKPICFGEYLRNGSRVCAMETAGRILIWNDRNARRTKMARNRRLTHYTCGAVDKTGGLCAAATFEGKLELWNAEEMRRSHLIEAAEAGIPVTALAFHPKERLILTGDGHGRLRCWGFDGRESPKIPGHVGDACAVAIHPDGSLLASAGRDNTVRLWSLRSQKQLKVMGCRDVIHALSFASSGKLLLGKMGNEILAWQTRSGKPVSCPRNALQFFEINNPTAPMDGTRKPTSQLTHHRSEEEESTKVVMSPDGKSELVIHPDEGILVRRPDGSDPTRINVSLSNGIESAVYHPSGQEIAAACHDGTIRLYGVAPPRTMLELEGILLTGQAFSPDGARLVTVRKWSDAAVVYDLSTGKVLLELEKDCLPAASAFSPSGRFIATVGVDRAIGVWDSNSGKLLTRWKGRMKGLNDITFSPNERNVAVACDDGCIWIWSWRKRELVHRIGKHRDIVYTSAYSPDGRTLVSASRDHTARVWDTSTGRERYHFDQHKSDVKQAAFSPNGIHIALASFDGTASIHQIGRPLAEEAQLLVDHKSEVLAASFSPDGKFLITGSRDKTARVWELESGREIRRLDGHGDSVMSALFAPDGQTIVTASQDRTVRVWNGLSTLLETALSLVQRMPQALTGDERRRYGLDP